MQGLPSCRQGGQRVGRCKGASRGGGNLGLVTPPLAPQSPGASPPPRAPSPAHRQPAKHAVSAPQRSGRLNRRPTNRRNHAQARGSAAAGGRCWTCRGCAGPRRAGRGCRRSPSPLAPAARALALIVPSRAAVPRQCAGWTGLRHCRGRAGRSETCKRSGRGQSGPCAAASGCRRGLATTRAGCSPHNGRPMAAPSPLPGSRSGTDQASRCGARAGVRAAEAAGGAAGAGGACGEGQRSSPVRPLLAPRANRQTAIPANGPKRAVTRSP